VVAGFGQGQGGHTRRVAGPTGASVSHVLPAVDREDLAGDEAGVRVGKEFDRAGDFLRFAKSADGDLRNHLVQGLLRHGGDHVGGDVARGHVVDGDPPAGGLLGERHREAEQPDFAAA
jgi:hypothetical protein